MLFGFSGLSAVIWFLHSKMIGLHSFDDIHDVDKFYIICYNVVIKSHSFRTSEFKISLINLMDPITMIFFGVHQPAKICKNIALLLKFYMNWCFSKNNNFFRRFKKGILIVKYLRISLFVDVRPACWVISWLNLKKNKFLFVVFLVRLKI